MFIRCRLAFSFRPLMWPACVPPLLSAYPIPHLLYFRTAALVDKYIYYSGNFYPTIRTNIYSIPQDENFYTVYNGSRGSTFHGVHLNQIRPSQFLTMGLGSCDQLHEPAMPSRPANKLNLLQAACLHWSLLRPLFSDVVLSQKQVKSHDVV